MGSGFNPRARHTGVGVKRFSVAEIRGVKGLTILALATCPYTLKGLSRKAGTQHMILAR